jgi:hypothetical protein
LKKFLLVAAILSLAGAAGFYFYTTQYAPRVDLWKMVPGNAVLVYENPNAIGNWNAVVKTPVWSSLQSVPRFAAFERTLEEIDSITGRDGALDRLFRNNDFLVSAHVTSSTTLDFLLFLDIGENHNQVRSDIFNILKAMADSKGYRQTSRSYQGIEIDELNIPQGDRTFSYMLYKTFFVGSFTPFLVEDVIRHINSRFANAFSEKIDNLQGLSRLENDDGNLYVDMRALPDLLSVFLNPASSASVSGIGDLARNMYLDVKVTEDELLFNGSTMTAPQTPEMYLNTLSKQEAGDVRLARYLPQQTAYCYSLNFSDFSTLQKDLVAFWNASDPAQMDSFRDFDGSFTFQTDWIGGEAGIAVMEPVTESQHTALAFIECTDTAMAMLRLMDFAEHYATRTGDTVFSEQYGDHRIVQLTYEEFPQRLFGRQFHGFQNSYFTPFGEYLVFGNSMQATKLFLDDISQEEIWGKSVRQIDFLENTLGESSINLMVNIPRCWKIIHASLNDHWGAFFSANRRQIVALDMIAFQISNLENRYYTSLAVGHSKTPQMEFGQSRFKKRQSAYTLSPITTKPTIVRNHNNNRLEVLLQDSLHYLYLTSNEGEILWADSLGVPIATDIYQIDFYKNSKLQYLFASARQLHLLDRNGDYVANYPLTMPGRAPVEFLHVVDYDNTKRYRFMVANTDGDIYLFDKEQNNLDGWTPKATGGRLTAAPFHVRIKGRDCIVALRRDGVLTVINRRGNDYPGFPIDLKDPISSPLFVQPGNDFQSTYLTTITTSGQLIQTNLQGAIKNREQLYRASSESTFQLVPDVLEKDYIIVRQDFSTLSFIDQDGNLIFEKNFVTSGQLIVQYYNFGSENKIYVVVDTEQEFTYIYNKSGDLVNSEPVESGFPIALIYSSDARSFNLYNTYFNRFSMYEFE